MWAKIKEYADLILIAIGVAFVFIVTYLFTSKSEALEQIDWFKGYVNKTNPSFKQVTEELKDDKTVKANEAKIGELNAKRKEVLENISTKNTSDLLSDLRSMGY